MAKQLIIAAVEEVFGEYILNISKDNLKIAALRGQLKLENVQLDGDLIGSHVLGVFGLSSFGVLSCSARSIKVSVPWKNLEREPTKIEVRGVHLVCVPLTPSTAHQMYGAGDQIDPRCTLRTRAKRLVLARLERNFWNGQIPGEGPVMKRIRRAVKDVERSLKRNSKQMNRKRTSSNTPSEETEMDMVLENLVQSLGGSSNSGTADASRVSCASEHDTASSFTTDEIPELPRDWKVKLREKVMRNMEASIFDMHIRCEVPEHGLDFCSVDVSPSKSSPRRNLEKKPATERAFTIGFTLESLVVRTANKQWQIGSHNKRKNDDVNSSSESTNDHLGPNEYVIWNNKIGYFKKLSVYFDDEPPILLSEADVLRGNYRKLSADKLLSRVSAAMEILATFQEPGIAVRQLLCMATPW
jgi:N-terminal region of Chorein or VPS13/Vacuolar sorting-associated protein 13, N-terminal